MRSPRTSSKKVHDSSGNRPVVAAPAPGAAGFGDRYDQWESLLAKAALIVLACLWIYSPVYDGEWLWDDDYLLTQNTVVHAADGLPSLWVAPATADYLPLTMSALWLQWRFFGLDSTGYHFVSILLHALGACLLWAVLQRMKVRGAWLAGFVFAVHPICVESVAWISELKNTFSLPFFLAAVWFFVRYEEKAERRFYFAALGFFLLAMLAKSSVVMFPFVMLLYVWWKRRRISWADVFRTVPFFAISLLLGLLTLHFQSTRAIGDEPIPIGGFDSRLAIAGMAILFYLTKLFWPIPLLPIYPQWQANPPDPQQLLPLFLIAGSLALFWMKRKTWGRDALMGTGFYLIMLLPVLGFVPMSYMRVGWVADHFIYIPMLGVIAFATAAGVRAFELARARMKPLFLGGATGILFGLMVLSYNYAAVWKNEDELWTHTLPHNPDSWQAHNRLGAREFNRGNVDVALEHFLEAVRLRPDLAETQNNLGSAVLAKKDTKSAVKHFREALRLTPSIVAIQSNLANALVLDEQIEAACELYADLVRRFPSNPTFLCNLGVTFFRTGHIPDSIICFEQALKINPNLGDASENLKIARQALADKNAPVLDSQ
jgi:tetratricopeptide (TPR) repeat protein